MSDVQASLLENTIDEDYQKIEEVADTKNLIDKLESLREATPITEIYIKISLLSEDLVEELSNYCDNKFIRLRLVLDWQRVSSKVIESRNISHTTVLNIPLTPLDDPYNTLLKRSFCSS